MSSSRGTLCIEHPVWCRVVGVVWELAIVSISMALIPGLCAMMVAQLLALTPPAIVLSVPFILLGMFSLVFGCMWSFRRHLPATAN